MKPFVLLRRAVQAVSFGLFFSILYSTTYPLEGKIPVSILLQADPLVMFATSISERVVLNGLLVSAGFCLSALVFGRFFCGWLCPFGAMLDFSRLLYPGRRRGAGSVAHGLIRVKFLLLALIFLAALAGVQAAWVFDPLVITARFLSLNVIPVMTQGVHSAFVFVIRTFGLYGGLYDVYHILKESILGLNAYYFSSTLPVLLFTAGILAFSVLFSRLWCRVLCPLGAGYGFLATGALFRRRTAPTCTHCNVCVRRCRMGAIADGGTAYNTRECILCMDCVYDCPQSAVRFSFSGRQGAVSGDGESKGMSRRQFLLLLAAGLFSFGAKSKDDDRALSRGVIRPPGALPERAFLDRCVRCGNCMKVCITNGLQPCFLEAGLEGIWTPRLVPAIGYCEYHCRLCGTVCPTGALEVLTEQEKAAVKIGRAVIDKDLCLPWAEGKECLVCEEHCPVADKAIKLERDASGAPDKPSVDPSLCVGCGICEAKCPVRPVRAIRVYPTETGP